MIVRRVRSNACSVENPNIECAKWTMTRLRGDGQPRDSNIPLEWWEADDTGPYQRTGEYVCGGCKTPQVTAIQLLERLLDKDSDGKQVHKTFRRYLNGEVGMMPNTLRKLVAHAFLEDWLGRTQIMSILMQIDMMEATKLALLKVFKQAGKHDMQQAMSEDQFSQALKAALESEYETQLLALDDAAEARVKARRNAHLSPEMRYVIDDWRDRLERDAGGETADGGD